MRILRIANYPFVEFGYICRFGLLEAICGFIEPKFGFDNSRNFIV